LRALIPRPRPHRQSRLRRQRTRRHRLRLRHHQARHQPHHRKVRPPPLRPANPPLPRHSPPSSKSSRVHPPALTPAAGLQRSHEFASAQRGCVSNPPFASHEIRFTCMQARSAVRFLSPRRLAGGGEGEQKTKARRAARLATMPERSPRHPPPCATSQLFPTTPSYPVTVGIFPLKTSSLTMNPVTPLF